MPFSLQTSDAILTDDLKLLFIVSRAFSSSSALPATWSGSIKMQRLASLRAIHNFTVKFSLKHELAKWQDGMWDAGNFKDNPCYWELITVESVG